MVTTAGPTVATRVNPATSGVAPAQLVNTQAPAARTPIRASVAASQYPVVEGCRRDVVARSVTVDIAASFSSISMVRACHGGGQGLVSSPRGDFGSAAAVAARSGWG